jgi:hypothetical protein
VPLFPQGLAVRPQTAPEKTTPETALHTPLNTIETFRDALTTLAGRYRADEVLTAVKHIPAREAQFRPMPDWVRPELRAAYRAKGI